MSGAFVRADGTIDRFAKMWVPSGATLHFTPTGTNVFRPYTGQQWFAQLIVRSWLFTESGSGLLSGSGSYVNPSVPIGGPQPEPHDWVLATRSWTNTGPSRFAVVQLRTDPFLIHSYSYVLEMWVTGGGGDTGPPCEASYLLGEEEWFGSRESGGYVQDPVNTTYGNLHDVFVDLPATAGVFGLAAERSYNSQDDTVGVLGRGWREPFSQTLAEDAGEYRLVLADARHVTFEADGSGGWVQPWEFSGELALDPVGGDRIVFPNGEQWRFDGDGRMVELSSWDGQSVTIARGGGGEPTTATSSLGPSLSFSYSGDRLVGIAASDGRSVAYGYTNGELTSFTDATGGVTAYGVDAAGRVATITDPTGLVLVDNTYNTAGRVVSQTTPDSTTTFVYDIAGRTTTVTTVETGETIVFEHDEFGRVKKLSDPEGNFIVKDYDAPTGWMSEGVTRLGGVTVLAYDTAGNPTSMIGADGVETTYAYDAENRVMSSTTAASGTTTYAYSGSDRVPSTVTDAEANVATQTVVDGLVTSSVDPDGVETLYRYNGLRQLVEVEDAVGNVTEMSYDAAGRVTSVESPGGAVTETEYDAAGRPTKQVAADGGETLTEFDAAGRVVKVTDPTGAETATTYDPQTGLVATETDPMGRVTSYTYDSAGRLERTTFSDGSFTETDHGLLGRVVAERDELGRETSYTHDADGNVAEVTDAAGGTASTDYDAAGRVETETDAAGRATTFDYHPTTGLLVSESSPAGTTSYTYDPLGRVATVTDHRGGVTTTSYTDAGRVAAVTDPVGLVTTYGYDPAGRQVSETAPGGLETVTVYDPDGRGAEVTSPGGLSTTFTYDPVGRVVTETDPAGVSVTNTWSLRGEIRTVTRSGEGTVEFAYLPDGQLDWVDDALGNRTSFTYDTRGRLAARTDPHGKVWATAYNPAGELVAETDPLDRTTLYSYDPTGRLAAVADPSGRTVTNTWRTDGLLESWTATDGTDTITGEFGYDIAGRRTAAVLDTVGVPNEWSYSYTPGGDLASVTDPTGRTLGYSYDAAGRRTELRRADGSGVTYSYDAAGRVASITPTETFADTFTGTAGAPDANKWSVNTQGGATAELVDNRARLAIGSTAPSSVSLHGFAAPQAANGDTTLSYQFDSTDGTSNLRIHQRYLAESDNYRLQIQPGSTTARIYRSVWGNTAQIASFTVPSNTDKHWARFQVQGSTVRAKVWADGDPEPATWSAQVNNNQLIGNGRPRVAYVQSSGPANAVHIDDLTHHNPTVAPDPLVSYSYDDDSHITGETLAAGGARGWTWVDGQLVESTQNNIAGHPARTSTLSYDTAGRLASDTTAGVTTSYGYDDAGQLTSATPTTGPASTWSYDDLGRRTTQTIGTDTTLYGYDDAGQLTTTTPASGPATAHSYDPAGRRTADTTGAEVTAYGYDPAGRLRSVEQPDGDTQARSYGPDDQLWQLLSTDGVDVDVHVLDWDTTPGLAEPVTIADDGASSDAHNRLAHLTRTPGAPAWATEQNGRHTRDLPADVHGSTQPSATSTLGRATGYTEWGEPETGNDTLTPRLGYRGELHTGDHLHLRARDYQPHLGQFTTVDPLDGINATPVRNHPYHYTNNTPLNLTDPTGLQPDDGDLRIDLPKDLSPEMLGLPVDLICRFVPVHCALWGVGNEKGIPADGQPVRPVAEDAWVGPNQHGCTLKYEGGARVHLRESTGYSEVGIKIHFHCRENPGMMTLDVEIVRKRGWFWTEVMNQPPYSAIARPPQTSIKEMKLSARCAPGLHRYYAHVVAQTYGTDGSYTIGVSKTVPHEAKC